jgi:hypothetical protein
VNGLQIAVARDLLVSFGALASEARARLQPVLLALRDHPHTADWQALEGAQAEVWTTSSATVVGFSLARGAIRLLAWVGPQSEAEAWGRAHVARETPEGIELRLKASDEVTPDAVPEGRLLAGVARDELLDWGVPVALLPAVVALRSARDLQELVHELPLAAQDNIQAWLSGAAAASVPSLDSRERIAEDVDDALLQTMLGAPLDQWRVFLHPSQRALVEMNSAGPVRVLGGAGTGKTVVLLHRAARLVHQSTGPQRILVTTFTRNLAGDLEIQLGSLLHPKDHPRVEVVNLHRWAVAFLRRQGVRCVLAQDRRRRRLMEQATLLADELGFSARFYLEEWDQVVQTWEVVDRRGYLRAPRSGRGTRLTRRDRMKVWDVLAEYRGALDRDGLMERSDVVREARILVDQSSEGPPYAHVLADEVQDFSPGDLRLLRALVAPGPDDLFLVGDPHQRIYGRAFPFSHCGIQIVGRGRRLRLNYRTTEAVRQVGLQALQGATFDDLDGGTSSLDGTWSLRLGTPPAVECFATREDELDALVTRIQEELAQRPAEDLCVAARTRRLLEDEVMPALLVAGIPHCQLEASGRSAGPGVRVATLHRLKGLEFAVVCLIGIEEGVMPAPRADDGTVDALSRDGALQQERSLFYVAATRARDELWISGTGALSPFVATKRETTP